MLPSPMKAFGRRAEENNPDELHLAVLTGRTKKIKHLLKKGVHIESVNSLGQTPLFCASYGGDFEIVELLLRLGANPNRRCGSEGATSIHAAAFRGSRRVLRLLVEAGADLSLRDSNHCSPRDYAEKQPNPIRRQKVLEFLDLLYAMTLHRAATSMLPVPSMVSHTDVGTLTRNHKLKGFFGGSQLSLARKHSQSQANLFSSCVSEASSVPSSDEADTPKAKEPVMTENLHKNVSCHLIDQLCVTTSLPLLTPDQLSRPAVPSPAYTCGGPTVYSSFSWIGTPVTVRRPTPALALTKLGHVKEGGGPGVPDEEAVQSLLQELSFLRRLRHPGFLEVMAACHVTHPSPDHVTLVYQNIAHGSLFHHLHVKHHDLSVGGAVDILLGLVEALLFMHAHGWFHCGLSSHCIHLVSLGCAKLGGFEYALERQAKGVGMRAEHISKATWLTPWQAPETIVEQMVSTRSEVYSVAAIIWEIWSGMAPWSGVEEEVVIKKISDGESLPPLLGATQSLISYLTQYGLKWNSHERELDLQEMHTMLRSLRIQCNEEERVPAVTSWGPPSIPNTPVVGRHSEPRLGRAGGVFIKGAEARGKAGADRRFSYEDRSSFEIAHESVRRQFALMAKKEEPSSGERMEGSRDSGFSTPCSRTPSPTAPKCTSTPIRSSIVKPDLLPNKMNPRRLQVSPHSPDLLLGPRQKDESLVFVQNAAKRAFLLQGESSTRRASDAESAISNVLMDKRRQVDVVKRGLSMTNLSVSAGSSSSTSSVFTRTTSHISLCSSAEMKPVSRTVSQITLTLKKLSKSEEDSRNPVSQERLVTIPSPEGRRESPKYNNEILGIKPASHQLTRHSSSCSLASGPSSPAHMRPLVSDYSLRKLPNSHSHGSLPTSPTKLKTVPVNPRPLSVFSDRDYVLRQATLPPKTKKHSDVVKRRTKKKQQVEVEEEFIDDEFNSLLYDQPHMQLSIGSAENLLDSRLSFCIVDDSGSSSSSEVRTSTEELSSGEKVDERNPKDLEPLKNVQVLRHLQKNLTNYLPSHSVVSDSD